MSNYNLYSSVLSLLCKLANLPVPASSSSEAEKHGMKKISKLYVVNFHFKVLFSNLLQTKLKMFAPNKNGILLLQKKEKIVNI